MLGDAAGMITPLCGNGMSMAIHGSKIAADHIHRYLSGEINLQMMEEGYKKDWNNNFGKRLKMGRRIQWMFGNGWLMGIMIKLGKTFPGIIRTLVRNTHGKPF